MGSGCDCHYNPPCTNNCQPHQVFVAGTVEERIHHLRRLVLIHSIIYYRLNSNLVTDHRFDAWCYDLVEVQNNNPDARDSVLYHHEAFMDFTGETGAFLPLDDVRAVYRAKRLLDYYDEDE